MQIIVIASRTRQGGRLTQALLSAGSTWHARPLAASVCAVVPAAAVATGHSRAFLRPMQHLTHQPQLETVGKRHPRSLSGRHDSQAKTSAESMSNADLISGEW